MKSISRSYRGMQNTNTQLPDITRKEQVILSLLISRGQNEQYGLELVKESDGQLKKGTVYVLLQRLEEKGFVESKKEKRIEGARGLPRRLYKITATGKYQLNAIFNLAAPVFA